MGTSTGSKLSLREKLSYSCGDMGVNLISNFIGSYFLMFMTDVMGISPFIGGVVFAAARLWDAFNDPLMGSISERVKPKKWGRYRSWMLFSIVPFTVFFILCFTNPNLGLTAKVLYIGIIYICYGMSATVYQVPYGSLSSVMTTNTQEYAVLGVFRDYGANLSGTVVNAVAVVLIMFFGGTAKDSAFNARGYLFTAVSIGLVSFLFLLLAFAGTRERVQVSSDPTPLRDCFRAFRQNRPSQVLCCMIIFASLGVGFRMVWTPYYCLYYLGNPDMIAVILTTMFSLPLIGLFFVPALVKKLGKKTLLVMGNACLIISGVLFMFAKTSTALIMVGAVFCGMSMSFTYSVIWGILPDTANYGEWKTGIRATGFIYAIGMFALKLGTAVANLGAGTYLQLLGYHAELGMNQLPAVQQGINLANGLTSLVLGIGAIITIQFYRLDKKQMDVIEAELAQRRAGGTNH